MNIKTLNVSLLSFFYYYSIVSIERDGNKINHRAAP